MQALNGVTAAPKNDEKYCMVITELKQELDKKDQLIYDMTVTMERIKD